VIDNVSDTVENVEDAASETLHRVAAQAEKQERNLAGDNMTTDAKAVSMLNQAKETAQGDVDAMKRADRNKA
jgi:hypothetical protein